MWGKCCSTHFFGSLLQEEGSKLKGGSAYRPSIFWLLLLDPGDPPPWCRASSTSATLVLLSRFFLPFLVLPVSPIFFLLTRLWLIRWRVGVQEKRIPYYDLLLLLFLFCLQYLGNENGKMQSVATATIVSLRSCGSIHKALCRTVWLFIDPNHIHDSHCLNCSGNDRKWFRDPEGHLSSRRTYVWLAHCW